MPKVKILWMSNKVQSETNNKTTGGWLNAMAEGLVRSGEIELANISHGRVNKITRQDFGEVRQWIVPISKPTPRQINPSNKIVQEIIDIIKNYNPDLIHVWGTENIWGLIILRTYLNKPTLLEMQGLKGSIARVFDGGLTPREKLACIGLREILKQSTMFQEQRRFTQWKFTDEEIIRGNRWITVQTEWVKAQVQAINNQCEIFNNDLLLRDDFYNADPWTDPHNTTIFCSTAYPAPYKGLHVAIRAISILKEHFPNVQLQIAGDLQKHGIRQNGYIGWLNREVKRLHLDANITWLGALSAAQTVMQIQQASVMVLPSFIENCSNLVQEGMMLGVPLVVSYVGGLPSLARDEETALFFPAGDETMCAHQIKRLLVDKLVAEQLSRQARANALDRNNFQKVLQSQIQIYHQVIAEHGKGIVLNV